MSASKLAKTAENQSPTARKYDRTVAEWRTDIQKKQQAIEARAALGARFLALVSEPPLPVDQSVAGLVVERFDGFSPEGASDTIWINLGEYIDGSQGSGRCYTWLHERLRGLTHGDYDTAWDIDETTSAVLLVLRYVRPGANTIAAGEYLLGLANDEYSSASTDDHGNAVRSFFASLDDDPFWAANPLETTQPQQ